jgi:hypothetical protein
MAAVREMPIKVAREVVMACCTEILHLEERQLKIVDYL